MYNYICTSRYVYIFILRWFRKKGAHDEKKETAEKFKQKDWIKDKEEEKISGEDGKNVSPKWLRCSRILTTYRLWGPLARIGFFRYCSFTIFTFNWLLAVILGKFWIISISVFCSPSFFLEIILCPTVPCLCLSLFARQLSANMLLLILANSRNGPINWGY